MSGESNFLETISSLLSQGQTLNALSHLTDNRNHGEVQNNAWDLVPVIAAHLNTESETERPEVYRCCQKLVDIVAEVSKPEEVLLQFIEEIETATDDAKLLALIKPTERVLKRLPDNRVASIAWCFNAIVGHIHKIEPPEDLELSEGERVLLDCHDTVIRMMNLYTEILAFFEYFVGELEGEALQDSKYLTERKQVLGKFLIELLDKPMAHCHLSLYHERPPEIREKVIDVIQLFMRVKLDPFVFFEMRDGQHNADLSKPSDLALGTFYYMLLPEATCSEYIPKVYDRAYVLQHCLRYINVLLIQENQYAIENGVDLADYSVRRFSSGELSYLVLDSECHSEFCCNLSNVIIYNKILEIRQKSLEIFRHYMWSFEPKGRYLLICNVIPRLEHSGLKGYIIGQFKDMISQALTTGLSVYYTDHHLYTLLTKFTYLKDKETSDLVEGSDQIIATLNLMRYIVLVDKSGTVIKLDRHLHKIISTYFAYLRKGLCMSKEHYNMKVKEALEDPFADYYPNLNVHLCGKKIPGMPEKKVDLFYLALNTLDMIESLLSRLEECILDRK